MEIWGLTHRGKVREENQDAYYIRQGNGGPGMGVVCDGMGGARGGHEASELAIERFVELALPGLTPDATMEELSALLKAAGQGANTLVHSRGLENPALRGMGTTLVAAAVGEKQAVVVNVGDSRAYHFKDGGIRQITRDHSVVEDMVRQGKISRHEAQHHPQKNLITRALGSEETVECDVFQLETKKGEYLLLCSDGLSNLLAEEEMAWEIWSVGRPETACDRLLQRTLLRGAPDNVTIVLIAV